MASRGAPPRRGSGFAPSERAFVWVAQWVIGGSLGMGQSRLWLIALGGSGQAHAGSCADLSSRRSLTQTTRVFASLACFAAGLRKGIERLRCYHAPWLNATWTLYPDSAFVKSAAPSVSHPCSPVPIRASMLLCFGSRSALSRHGVLGRMSGRTRRGGKGARSSIVSRKAGPPADDTAW